MNWMNRWPGPFPIFVGRARRHRSPTSTGTPIAMDFCLGDTGAMCGHSPAPTVAAIARQTAARHRTDHALPTGRRLRSCRELAHRCGLPLWQIALSATDANRFALRFAREITGRPRRSSCSTGCYPRHGRRDVRHRAGRGRVASSPRPEASDRRSIRPSPPRWSRVQRPRRARAGAAPPATGPLRAGRAGHHQHRHRAARPRVPRRTPPRSSPGDSGTLLVIDETHTLCAGPGG